MDRISCHILVVEPEQRLQRLLLEMLDCAGYEVTAASSGDEMRGILSREAHQVVIINLELRRDDAMALADFAARRGCSVIAVPDTPSQFQEASSRGYQILVQPLDRRRVLERIERARLRAAGAASLVAGD